MTIDRRSLASLLVLLAASSSCRDAPLSENVTANNKAPTANAGEAQMLADPGTPVTVTLDGSLSTDDDGVIVTYRWLSATDAPDGGVGRGGMDPDDVKSPVLTLTAGTWDFTLFVIDDEGGVSQPDTVRVQIGSDVPPEVTECIAASLPTIAEECRSCVCGLDEMCIDAITGCDQACWDFYGCVQNECGSLTLDPADMDALADCVRMSCSAFFGGVGTYMPVQPCLDRAECQPTCSASVITM